MGLIKWVVILLLQLIFIGDICGKVMDDSISKSKLLKGGTRKTNHFKRHAIKSILSEDGDIIDCIDIYKQPAFDHPALKNHTIQMAPTYGPTMEKTTTITKTSRTRKDDNAITITSQLWQRRGSCPKGTIPILRIRKKDLIKGNGNHTYGRKKPSHQAKQLINDNGNNLVNHSLAVLTTEGYSYSGAKGDIKVWNPTVEEGDEYSTSQVTLKNGAYYDFEAVESGWAVNPSVYKDNKTRYFVYWTADASKTTGCFDLTCPGFVQVNHEIALGGAIYPISNPYGLPYQIIVYIYRDPITSNWWVQFGEKITIGYWPAELFKLLRYQAVLVQWGGEVYSSKIGDNHPHTATAMGSGKYPDYIFGTSGSIKRIRVEENSHELKFPEWVNAHSDEYNCYDVYYISDYVEDPEFYYGGPGRCDRCP